MAKIASDYRATSGVSEAIARAYLEQGRDVVPNRATDRRTGSPQIRVCSNPIKIKQFGLFHWISRIWLWSDCLLRYFGNDKSG